MDYHKMRQYSVKCSSTFFSVFDKSKINIFDKRNSTLMNIMALYTSYTRVRPHVLDMRLRITN